MKIKDLSLICFRKLLRIMDDTKEAVVIDPAAFTKRKSKP